MNQLGLDTTVGNIDHDLIATCTPGFDNLAGLSDQDRIATLNELRRLLHEQSPFSAEPVDYVKWVPVSAVAANDYNPNTVADPEMKLLELSISEDGFTQPVVTWEAEDGMLEVVDGFHRSRVVRESSEVGQRLDFYMPVTIANASRNDRGDRIASTIRHNRARGKHRIDAMSEIVLELKRRNWSPKKIGRELGMDPDEVLRLAQITGLAEMFKDRSFSEAWEADTLEDEVEVIDS